MKPRTPAIPFGELARLVAGARESGILRALAVQQGEEVRSGRRRRIGRILREEGLLSEDDVRRLLHLQATPELIPGYVITGKLGSGGMGVVYRAIQKSLERTVALKIIDSIYTEHPRFRERFFREARNAARLSHPNVVQPIDFGEGRGCLWLAMEVVEGPSVGDRLDREGPFGEREALDIGAPIARAIGHLWENGVVHRDVKPHNILLGPEAAKLTDLGLSKHIEHDGTITSEGSTLGTPYYISPELATGEAVDFRSDLYSLGATLYHMLTGEPPYQADTKVEVMEQHVNSDVPPLRSKNPKIAPATDRVVRRMMARDPRKRHPTAEACARDLEHCLRPSARAARSTGKRRTSRPAVPVPGARRRRAAAWIAAALGVLALALVAWAAHRVRAGEPPIRLDPAAPGVPTE